MTKAYVFPGQGAQFTGMGKELYEAGGTAKALFDQANDILGFSLTDIMFTGSADDLKQTKVTQPAVFLHSVAVALANPSFAPNMVAGHSLGELSALVANKTPFVRRRPQAGLQTRHGHAACVRAHTFDHGRHYSASTIK